MENILTALKLNCENKLRFSLTLRLLSQCECEKEFALSSKM